MKKVRRFKFLQEGMKSQYDGHKWEIGRWYKTECKELCHGFNCSKRIIDAMSYVQGEILAEVEVRGKKFVGNDKSTHAEMRVIRAWKWTKKDSVALAIFVAEWVIDLYEKKFPGNNKPRKAIEAAKVWAICPTVAARAAAYAAANDAHATAIAIADAAIDVAACAAHAAAHATCAAAYAAYAATHAAQAVYTVANAATAACAAARNTHDGTIKNKIQKWLLAHIETLKEIT